MPLFGFFKKKGHTENNTDQIKHESSAAWEGADAISINSQHVSGNGMHISCDVRYSPSYRLVVCRTVSTSDPAPRYESMAVPEDVKTADGLIALIVSKRRSWLMHGCNPDNELKQRINASLKGKSWRADKASGGFSSKAVFSKQCQNDQHDFIQTDALASGTTYKCDKCGLTVHSPVLSGKIF